MIDLTKPLRWKWSKDPAKVLCIIYPADETPASGLHEYITELENFLENITEPRKPRQWTILACDSDRGDRFYCGPSDTECEDDPQLRVRVIEWPEGAPLPDWPEGY